MRYFLVVVLSTIAVWCDATQFDPLFISASLNASTCNLTWRIRNNTHGTLEFSEGQMPWAEGIAAPTIQVHVEGQLIPQKHFGIKQYLRFVKLPPGASKSKTLPVSLLLNNWEAPKADLHISWKYAISNKAIHKQELFGELNVPMKCVR